MSKLYPVYTEKAQCQDCYKCVRHCPVKSIRVENGNAIVNPQDCILCGNCVAICPVNAKKIRDDLPWVKQIIKDKQKVIVSLAPSWVTEFPELTSQQMLVALKKLGFWGVSETAFGAQIVSSAVADLIRAKTQPVMISTACPVIVEYIRKYHPHLTNMLTPLLSPALTHAKFLKAEYGEDIGIVFIGPCIGKKLEAAENPELIDLSLTFEDLRHWWQALEINPKYLTSKEPEQFIPEAAAEGVLYPIDGGMIDGVKKHGEFENVHFMSISGGVHIQHALDGLDEFASDDKQVFIEILACDGGCINGPRSKSQSFTALKRIQINDTLTVRPDNSSCLAGLATRDYYVQNGVYDKVFTPQEIDAALRKIGIVHQVDELNCGGCGYNTCREFVNAMLNGKAEGSMCVAHMRKLAMNKANALIKAMPSGVVIVNDLLQVIECNKKFVDILGGDAVTVYEVNPGLTGAYLNRLVPFYKSFQQILDSEDKSLEKEIRYNDKIIKLLVFPIEKKRIVGGIIQDITQPSVQREEIITKAEKIIKQNLTTVQQIAFLLGENAAESEILLNSIIGSFSLKN